MLSLYTPVIVSDGVSVSGTRRGSLWLLGIQQRARLPGLLEEGERR
jgi:hypothetical protein